MRSKSIALAAAAAAAATGGVVTVTAHGDPGATARTLTFHAPPPAPRDHHQVDVRPRGLSLGDQDIGALSLRTGGDLVGRMHAVCTITDASFQGRQCVLTLILRDGLITAQDAGIDVALPGTSSGNAAPPDVFAVTGGTGSYEGADGNVAIGAGGGGAGNSVVVTLRG